MIARIVFSISVFIDLTVTCNLINVPFNQTPAPVNHQEMIHRRGHSITLNHYQGIRINNDVALIRLAEPVPIGPDVIPVCLPTGTDSYQGQKVSPHWAHH